MWQTPVSTQGVKKEVEQFTWRAGLSLFFVLRKRDAGATKKMAGFFHRPEACATKARPTKWRLRSPGARTAPEAFSR